MGLPECFSHRRKVEATCLAEKPSAILDPGDTYGADPHYPCRSVMAARAADEGSYLRAAVEVVAVEVIWPKRA